MAIEAATRKVAAISTKRWPDATSAGSGDDAGSWIGWVALTRQREALEPVIQTIERIVRMMRAAGDERPVDKMTLGLTLLAIGDSLVGGEVARACTLPREAVREVAVTQIEALAGESLRD